MPKVTFHHDGGNADVLDVEPGTSLMRAAVRNGVRGIVGECGGQAMCATCHVYVRDRYLDALPDISEDEEEMLDCTTAPRDADRSRLGCQVVVGADLDAIEVDVPASQV
ncbi:2Fe-2S iron-sulfur cluster-binding protein [Geodermatophilus sp. URMC 65]|jgi:2Fe-2S ferredoxin